MGEENTKFFHAMATERYRSNSVSSITSDNGQVTSDHATIAGLFCRNSNRGWDVLITLKWVLICTIL